MAGVPAMNAAAGQSTLGAVMSPEQMADVDWGEDEPPDLGPGLHTLLKRGDEPDSGPAPLDSTNGQNTGDDAPPWTVSGQDPGLVPPGGAPSSSPTADQIDPNAPAAVTPPPVPSLPPKYLLDQIATGESAGDPSGRSGYDVIYGFGQTSKPLSRMTLDEVRQQQAQMGKNTPVGQYQITKDTIDHMQNELGLDDDTVFSPDVQDQMAQQLMADRGHWNDFINGKISTAQFGQNLTPTWSSLQDRDRMAQFQTLLSQVPRNK
jgi:muramidase (phage lysozyme)